MPRRYVRDFKPVQTLHRSKKQRKDERLDAVRLRDPMTNCNILPDLTQEHLGWIPAPVYVGTGKKFKNVAFKNIELKDIKVIQQIDKPKLTRSQRKQRRIDIKQQKAEIKRQYKLVTKEQKPNSFVTEFRARYAKYIKSSDWRKVKQSYRKDGTRFQNCWGCNVSQFERLHHFHHVDYRRLGRETLDDIIPVCEKCHTQIHLIHKTDNPHKRSIKEVTRFFCEPTIEFRKGFKEIFN